MTLDLSPFAWPLAFFLSACVFFSIFRKPIADRIANVRKVGRDGIDMNPPAEQDTLNPKKYDQEEFASKNVSALDVYIDPAIQSNFEKVQRITAQYRCETDKEKIVYSERFLARLLTDNNHLFTFLTIFGSQFRFLNQINGRIDVDSSEAENFFDMEKDKWPDAHSGRAFKDWIGFLVDKRLIAHSGGKYSITPLGQDFLKFRIESRITEPSVF